jgi:hypothetical protein
MLINERLVRTIMEKNPEREFYLEESFPLAGLYSNSVPHGLILKISRLPLERLSPSVIEEDHRFWTKLAHRLVGPVVDEDTSVDQLCAWAEEIYVGKNLKSFRGNPLFVRDAQAPQYFSTCRSTMANLYRWRMRQTENEKERLGLSVESDFAHRQAISLSPFNPIVLWRYVDFLEAEQRTKEAKRVLTMVLRIKPEEKMALESDSLKTSMRRLRGKALELEVSEPH